MADAENFKVRLNRLLGKFSTVQDAMAEHINMEAVSTAVLANARNGTMIYAKEIGEDGKLNISCWVGLKDYNEIEKFARYVNDTNKHIPSVIGKKAYTSVQLNKSLAMKILREEGYYGIDALMDRLAIPKEKWFGEMFRNAEETRAFISETFCMPTDKINHYIDVFNKMQKFASSMTKPLSLREISNEISVEYSDARSALKLFRLSLDDFYLNKRTTLLNKLKTHLGGVLNKLDRHVGMEVDSGRVGPDVPDIGSIKSIRLSLLNKLFGRELDNRLIDLIAEDDYDMEEISEHRDKIIEKSKEMRDILEKKTALNRYLYKNVFSPSRAGNPRTHSREFPKEFSSLFVNKVGPLNRLSELMYWNNVKPDEMDFTSFRRLLEMARRDLAGHDIIDSVFYELIKNRAVSQHPADMIKEMQRHIRGIHPWLGEENANRLAIGFLRRGINMTRLREDKGISNYIESQLQGGYGEIEEEEIQSLLETFGPEIKIKENNHERFKNNNRARTAFRKRK